MRSANFLAVESRSTDCYDCVWTKASESLCSGSHHRPHVISAPHQKSSAFIASKNCVTMFQPSWLMIYLNHIFNCNSIQGHNPITSCQLTFSLISPEATSRAQVNQAIFVPCSHNHVCFLSWIHNQFLISLKCARLSTTKFLWKFASDSERWKLIKIPHQILLKWLTRTITSTFIGLCHDCRILVMFCGLMHICFSEGSCFHWHDWISCGNSECKSNNVFNFTWHFAWNLNFRTYNLHACHYQGLKCLPHENSIEDILSFTQSVWGRQHLFILKTNDTCI
jgi:hypothetical protein